MFVYQQECDLGQQSILHAVKITPRSKISQPTTSLIEEDDTNNDEQNQKPLCETLTDSMFSTDESLRSNTSGIEEKSNG